MTDNYALGLFLSNLKPEISTDVQRFYPKDLTHLFNLAKKLEAKLLRSLKKASSHLQEPNFQFHLKSDSKSHPKSDQNTYNQ